MKSHFSNVIAGVVFTAGIATAAYAQDDPFRDITTAVIWGAGGGTDSINRMIMAELEKHLPLKQAIGFAAHNSASEDLKAKLGGAFETAIAFDVVAEWAAANNYDVGGQYGDGAQAIFATLEASFAYTLQELGAATVDPMSLGIKKP